MESNVYCKNKVSNQNELFEIIKFFHSEYKGEKDIIQKNKIIIDFLVFTFFNKEHIKDERLLAALQLKIKELKTESKALKEVDNELYNELNQVLDSY